MQHKLPQILFFAENNFCDLLSTAIVIQCERNFCNWIKNCKICKICSPWSFIIIHWTQKEMTIAITLSIPFGYESQWSVTHSENKLKWYSSVFIYITKETTLMAGGRVLHFRIIIFTFIILTLILIITQLYIKPLKPGQLLSCWQPGT